MFSQSDRTILRDAAKRVAEIAELPIQAERRDLWKKHNSLQPARPMILIFPEGSWEELQPDSSLQCEDDKARGIERELRSRIYTFEQLQDDTVIEKEWVVAKAVSHSGWGLSARHIPSTEARGAWKFDPIIKRPADLEKLKIPEVYYDEKATQRSVAKAQELFGDILDVKLKGIARVSFRMMNHYTSWRGLAEVMMDMCMNPQMLHDAMAFLEEANRRLVEQYVDMNLLSLNNDATYHSSGGNGYTDELPKPGFNPERVRPCDIWASAEAQEMAQVSPEMHSEFILSYQKRLLEPFGLNGYGCCEDLTHKLDDVLAIPNIRRISICPWSDVDACADKLGNDYIFSWKPKPQHLVGSFDEEMLRDYIGHTIKAAKDCVLEIILKDTHTCENHPERFHRWARIARQLVEEG